MRTHGEVRAFDDGVLLHLLPPEGEVRLVLIL